MDAKIPTEDTTALRRTRPSRTCTVWAQQRLQEQQAAERKLRPPKKEYKRKHRRREEEVEEEDKDVDDQEDADDRDQNQQHCAGGSYGKIQVFRLLLKINAEVSAEEFETALLTPNDTLSDI
ncbi:hypothetical protein EUTSA_v10026584mg [Eutrema salsugineum]|uniref:Uncharacterized protein n=1 Tax=Eutrema salsugineum TaxID=72664 RepID=V4ML88_EUTSA|nr:hypothetical protein EUTSA_v10026584mg [Eutrema salsugineum]